MLHNPSKKVSLLRIIGQISKRHFASDYKLAFLQIKKGEHHLLAFLFIVFQ